ncbi:reverse transcriptase domain-containing protein [Tanacetum coccineum]
MALKKRTKRASPATTTTTNTPVTNAQIDQGIADTLAARDADRSMNGDDSHNSGTGDRRQAPLARECTYLDFMKCKPLYFKGTKGVVELTQWLERMETELALMCASMFPEELDKIEKYVGGLPDMIHGSVAIAYTAGSGERKEYAGTLPLCYKSPAATNNQRNVTCYECGNQWHYKSYCPELKNRNQENQAEGSGTRGMVYALGGGETNQDPNKIEDEIEA